MINEQKDIILFTGQSGIKIRECLGRLVVRGKIDATILGIDGKMPKPGEDFKKHVLSLPISILEKRWSEAFDDTIKNIPETKDEHYLFLTFHATYYHQRKAEFVSPLDLNKLIELRERIKMVITLIDDCYDIYKRLLEPGEMYETILSSQDAREAMFKSISNLLTILEWRKIEIAFSRKIASFLGIPFFVIAVKHPYATVSRLILKPLTELKILYLSHPITAFRKNGYSRLPSFYTELNQFIKNLYNLEDIVLFIPDTIDEKRIKLDKSSNYIPELLEGWPLPFPDDELLFYPPHLRQINPLNPLEYDHTADEKLKPAISYLLKILDDKITEQIGSRDRTLIEQSSHGIIVYRPIWEGIEIPKGVEEEINYAITLRKEGIKNKRRIFLLMTKRDLGKHRIDSLYGEIIRHTVLAEKEKKDLEKLFFRWQNDPNKVSQLSEMHVGEGERLQSIRDDVEKIITRTYSFFPDFLPSTETAVKKGEMAEAFERQDEGWRKIWMEALKIPFVNHMSQEDYLSVTENFNTNEMNKLIEKVREDG
jgi:hypothetical protein